MRSSSHHTASEILKSHPYLAWLARGVSNADLHFMRLIWAVMSYPGKSNLRD